MAGGGGVLAITTFVIKTLFARPAGDFRLTALIAMSVFGSISTKFERKGKANCTLYQLSL